MYGTLSQPDPTPNDFISAHGCYHQKIQGGPFSLLGPDIIARQAQGLQTYGTALQPHNGRNQLIDAYQELLDALVYLEADLLEKPDARIATIQTIISHQAVFLQEIIGKRSSDGPLNLLD